MTGPDDKQVEDQSAARQPSNAVAPANLAQAPARRAMLRGAAATVPPILTLYSGAALARSSNLISTSDDTPPNGDQYLCLDESSVDKLGKNRFDLGEPPQAEVTAVPQRKYYRYKHTDHPVSAQEMCKQGGEYYYKASGGSYPLDDDGDKKSGKDDDKGSGNSWRKVKLRKGGLVSATALGSFAGHKGVKINPLKDII